MKIHIIIEHIIVRFTVFIFKLKALNRKISLWNTELVMLNKFRNSPRFETEAKKQKNQTKERKGNWKINTQNWIGSKLNFRIGVVSEEYRIIRIEEKFKNII